MTIGIVMKTVTEIMKPFMPKASSKNPRYIELDWVLNVVDGDKRAIIPLPTDEESIADAWHLHIGDSKPIAYLVSDKILENT